MGKFYKEQVQDMYELSPMQKGMLYHSLESERDPYHIRLRICLTGHIERQFLERSLQQLVNMHDVFRTTFVYEKVKQPLQVVLRERTIRIRWEDLSSVSPLKQQAHMEHSSRHARNNKIHLTKDPLLSVMLFKTGKQSFIMDWHFHHLILDGWCFAPMLKQWLDLYSLCSKDIESSRITDSPFPQYRTYIDWLRGKNQSMAQNYWKQFLNGVEKRTDIPQKNDGVYDYNHQSYAVDLGVNLSRQLVHLAKSKRVTLNTVYQTIWAVILQQYNQSDDVVFGTVISDRPAHIEGIERMFGLCINTVPIRLNSSRHCSFQQSLKKIHNQSLQRQEYAFLSLADIQKQSPYTGHLISHLFTFDHAPLLAEHLNEHRKDLKFKVQDIDVVETTNYDLNLTLFSGENASLKFNYNANAIHPTLIKQMGEHFQHVADIVVDNPNTPVQDISLLSDKEKERIITSFNPRKQVYSKHKNIIQLFHEQVQQTPQQEAVVIGNHSCTYEDLKQKSDQVAACLHKEGVREGHVVGLFAERSLELVIGMLATLKIGAAYLPLDPELPVERLRFMIDDCDVKIILEKNKSPIDDLEHVRSFSFSHLLTAATSGVDLKSDDSPASLAYIMYTSGSTGRPKGVMVEHRNVIRLVQNTNYVTIHHQDRILFAGSVGFDAITFEIFSALLNGASTHVVPKHVLLDVCNFSQFLSEHKITKIFLTTALFNQLAQERPTMFSQVDQLFVGGEALSPKHINRVRHACPDLNLCNIYGPTENTTFSTFFPIEKDYEQKIPIGKPIHHSTAYVLGQNRELLPVGIPGELHVGGDGVARGYVNRPEMTAERFIANPFIANERLYRTGDLVRWTNDGDLEYIGRLDHQVKINGYRIEPGEVQFHLCQHPDVKEGIVLAKTEGGKTSLYAYIVPANELDEMTLKDFLSERLPHYMLPARYSFLEEIPLTSNGKIDHKALSTPLVKTTKARGNKPRGEVEKNVAEIWRNVLEVQDVARNDNFYEIGGDSIKAVQIISRLRERGIFTDIRELFRYPVLSEFCRMIENKKHSHQSNHKNHQTKTVDLSDDELKAITEDLKTNIQP
ncbi:fengycin family lipopeptide synthetase E [Evansella caseinilytica]|uniref:Fengycin family lipopeptide synthetase E n=1 Tax=Evansella caseinilytica TaxID=1503961 RepID=A0A1H3PX73_9BACI|nr:non-ribosomal peptide synthetase [Evansella caseinilytica]SDZ05676.1 fengycin family lipopeptide synthetase E [Evansella caseinilytica]